MKYRVEKLNESICSIKLVPENRAEEAGLTRQAPESGFLAHYQQALTKYVHADATFVEIVSGEHYPAHVLVRYRTGS
ncbi:MAG: hypothetical protein EOO11_11090 [Chitinophagaceae bacterium]|nr:MAG: hypothetical protein EOO11_11090 [Chitinophagaceae bacterium]